jgi:hypothetical protein
MTRDNKHPVYYASDKFHETDLRGIIQPSFKPFIKESVEFRIGSKSYIIDKNNILRNKKNTKDVIGFLDNEGNLHIDYPKKYSLVYTVEV